MTRSSDARSPTKAEINETEQTAANAGRTLSYCAGDSYSLTLVFAGVARIVWKDSHSLRQL